MTFKQLKVAWLLFKVAFKVRMMEPVDRQIYLIQYRANVDASIVFTPEQKEAIHKHINQIEKFCEGVL